MFHERPPLRRGSRNRHRTAVFWGMNITKRFKSYFLRGLAVLLPTMLTLWILAAGYRFVQNNVTVHINKGVVWTLVEIQERKGVTDPNALEAYGAKLTEIVVDGPAGSAAGFLIALVVVFLVGALLASVSFCQSASLAASVELFICFPRSSSSISLSPAPSRARMCSLSACFASAAGPLLLRRAVASWSMRNFHCGGNRFV